MVIVRAQVTELQWNISPRVPGDTPGASLIADTLLASELDKEEPLCGRYASGIDETLVSELSLDGLHEISFRSFVVLKKLSYIYY